MKFSFNILKIFPIVFLFSCTEYLPGADSASRLLDTPLGVTASDGEFANKIVIEWDSVKDAVSYNVYRTENLSTEFIVIASTDSTYYEDAGIQNNKLYYYKIEAANNTSISGLSASDSGYCGTLE